MSDVAIVAAITGATSVLTSAVTALVTWQVSKNSSAVELAKVKAENERLVMGHREEERRNRQATYHRFLDAATSVFNLMGKEIEAENRVDAANEFGHLASGVVLFGPKPVRDAAIKVTAVFNQIGVALESQQADFPEKPDGERWRDASAPLVDEFDRKMAPLIRVMHADVTRGIADDSN